VLRQSFIVGSIGFLGFVGFLPSAAAAPTALTYRYQHHIVTVPGYTVAQWQKPVEIWTVYGRPFTPPSSLRVDGDTLPPLPAGVIRGTRTGWNRDAIKATLAREVSARLDQPAGTVTIRTNIEGAYTFDGVGLPGRTVDVDLLAELTVQALDASVSELFIPIKHTPPAINVEDPQLRSMGIRELVALGESDYHGSPVNRRHNISVGLKRFDGYLIPQGSVFSFVERLGPVDGTTGYRKELVIKGNKTEPDYGGGLCQVSTTAYRGVWEAGFPITERRNHSYAVSYYGPQGTDATTYVPFPDLKFTNDSPGALLIQTYTADDKAYFLYYGTAMNRSADVIGPYTWDRKPAPPPKTEYTAALKPGERKVLGHAVPGLKAAWFRVVRTGTGETVEPFYSVYEARPDFFQVGVAAGSGALRGAAGEEDLGPVAE
jgi:vancomycin resistance protein YoaR